MRNSAVLKSTNLPVFNRLKFAGLRKFEVGYTFRISKAGITGFLEGYTPNWTTDILQIVDVKISNPTSCLLNLMGSTINGSFHE